MALAVTALQTPGVIHMQPLFENATRRWRRCWQNQHIHNLDSEEVYDKFHDLLHLTTTMRIRPPLGLERQETIFGRHSFPELLPVGEGFDRQILVLVRMRVHSMQTDDSQRGHGATPPPVPSVVYVQCQKPAELVATTEQQRARMRDEAVFREFLDDLDARIYECRAGYQASRDFVPVNDGVRLHALFERVIAVLADMQHIRPYIINLSHDYILDCVQWHVEEENLVLTETPGLVEMPEAMRAFAPHAVYLHVGCGHMDRLPGWFGEFTSLTVLELAADIRETIVAFDDLSLTELPDGMWQLPTLEYLELAHLSKITTLPSSMANMTSLHTLVLTGMFHSVGSSIPGCIHTLPGLATLYISEIRATKMQRFLREPRAPVHNLREMHIFDCAMLRELPDDFAMFPGLLVLNVYDMQSLRILPRSMSCLKQLTRLEMRVLDVFGGDDSDEESSDEEDQPQNSGGGAAGGSADHPSHQAEHGMHDIFRGLDSLEVLMMSDLGRLTILPASVMQLTSLQTLKIEYVTLRLPAGFSNMSTVTEMSLSHLERGLWLLPEDMHRMQSLVSLRIARNRLIRLPDGLCDLSGLRILDLYELTHITCLPPRATELVALERLSMQRCMRLQHLPADMDRLVSLRSLSIDNCPELSELPASLARMTQLRALTISGTVACLANNSTSLHGIAGLTNLTALTFGPWEGDNFPVATCRLVHMQHLALQVQSDGRLALRDPTVFQKIAWVISCMPLLESLRIGHGRYAPRDALLVDLDLRDLSLPIVSLRAHPRMHLTTFGLYNANVHSVDSTYQFRYVAISTRMPILSYAPRYGLSATAGPHTDEMFLADWRLSVEKVLAFLQATHVRLGAGAEHPAMLSAELFQQISDYFLHRPQFDDLVRGIADM